MAKLLFTLILSVFSNSLSEDLSGMYFTKLEYRKLEGNIIEEGKATDVLDCCLRCKRLSECLSINFAHGTKNGLHGCVLMERNEKSNPGRLMASRVYHHLVRVVDNCTGIVCENGGTCTPSISKGVRCHCLQGFMGIRCERKYNWLKINSNPVCFETKNSSYGRFTLNHNGTITTIKLRHLSGLLTCNRDSLQTKRSHWGFGDKVLYTIITDSQDQRILPQNEFINYFPWLQYSIPGLNGNSTELPFKSFSKPMNVTAGQECRIWFGKDLTNTSEENNDGRACVDVHMYGWFQKN